MYDFKLENEQLTLYTKAKSVRHLVDIAMRFFQTLDVYVEEVDDPPPFKMTLKDWIDVSKYDQEYFDS